MPTTADPIDDAVSWRSIATLVLLALVLRLVMVQRDSDRLHTDPDAYVSLAQSLVDGAGYSTAGSNQPTGFRPPFYPLLLAGALSVGLPPHMAVVFCNLAATVVLVIMTVLLAEAICRSRPVALAAGVFVAADPLLLRYATEPMTECVSAALMTAALLAVVRQVTSPQAVKWGIIGGLLLGLSALCRPVAYVTCAVLTAILLIRAIGTERKRRNSILLALLPGIMAALTVSPWIIRNAVQFGRLIPATTHGGYTLLLGNNQVFYERVVSGQQDVWDGESLIHWQQTLQTQQRVDDVAPGDEVSSDRWMYARAVRTIREEPGMFFQACLLRWKRFWALTPSTESDVRSNSVMIGVALWYGAITFGLLGSVGTFFRKSQHRLPTVLLWASVASFLLIHTFYWTNTRMRAPLTGILAVLSAVGWSYWFAAADIRRRTGL